MRHCLFYILVLSVAAGLTSCSIISFSLDQPVQGSIGKTTVVPEAIPLPDSALVIPGPEYEAGWLHNVFFGKHYRDLWTTPIRVPVLDLATFAGGLTPIEQGGGFQTKSLRLKGNDGRLYAFRSVNKDPKKVLPAELQVTFAADVFQDQISSAHPASAVVVDELANALGVLHARPALVLLPDNDRLGEFRATFAGILGMIEEHPSAGDEDEVPFAGAEKIVKTLKLFEALEKDSESRVNSRAFLTARLLDVFVGDWDRHIDQWRWARLTENGRNVYYPIPRDRDQAFARFDGLFPWIAAMGVTQFESFYENFNNLYSLSFSGRFLDRRLLADLNKPAWDSVTAFVIGRLTDEVIDRAVRRLPPSYYEKNGTWLAAALKSRRNQLAAASETFYSQLAGFVDIHFSDKQELVEIRRLPEERVDVTAYRRPRETGEPKGTPVYHRVFDRCDTRELRLYLHGGDDRAVITGDVDASITVRVVGGKGDDELVDESVVHGMLWGIIPFISQADLKTYFHDSAGENRFTSGPGTSVDKRKSHQE